MIETKLLFGALLMKETYSTGPSRGHGCQGLGATSAARMPLTVEFTSRILEGLVVCRGLVRPRKGIGSGPIRQEAHGRFRAGILRSLNSL